MNKLIIIIFLSFFSTTFVSATPNIKARTAILMDYHSDEVLYEVEADAQIYPASMTKIMTAIVAVDLINKNKLSLDDKFTISDKLWAGHQKRKIDNKKKGHGFGYSLFDHKSPYTSTLSARYYKDGSEILINQSNINKNPRKLTPRECARLQGFPEEFIVDEVSKGQIYKQFGNSVCINVIGALANQLRSTLI